MLRGAECKNDVHAAERDEGDVSESKEAALEGIVSTEEIGFVIPEAERCTSEETDENADPAEGFVNHGCAPVKRISLIETSQ